MYYVLFFKSTKAEVKGTVVDGYPVEKRFTPKHLLSADVLFVFANISMSINGRYSDSKLLSSLKSPSHLIY